MQYCWCPIWTNRSVVNVWLGITADQQSLQPAVMWRSWFQEVRQPANHCRPFVVWVPVNVPHLVPANCSQWVPVNVHIGDQLTCQAGACCIWVCWSAVLIVATLFFLFSRKTLLIIYKILQNFLAWCYNYLPLDRCIIYCYAVCWADSFSAVQASPTRRFLELKSINTQWKLVKIHTYIFIMVIIGAQNMCTIKSGGGACF